MTPRERLRHRRMYLGLSLAELGQRAGLTKAHIHALEAGHSEMDNLTFINACCLAAALGMSLMELMEEPCRAAA
jgi:transcriptional regulator with XRE-family HTH domain